MSLETSQVLQLAGQWDAALVTAPSAARRAEILTDRHLWRLDPPGEALAAIEEVEPADTALAALLTSQLVYWHRLFGRGEPDAYGEHDPVDGFAVAAKDRRLDGWATLWHAVATEKLRGDAAAAGVGYARARRTATETGTACWSRTPCVTKASSSSARIGRPGSGCCAARCSFGPPAVRDRTSPPPRWPSPRR